MGRKAGKNMEWYGLGYKMRFKYYSILGLIYVLLLFCVSAVTVHYAYAQPGNIGLTISPLRSEINISPGTALDGILNITNYSEKPMSVGLSAEEFKVIDKKYDYGFMVKTDTSGWLSFSNDSITLDPRQSKKVNYRVNVPLSAEPGGKYISLFATTAVEGEDQANNSQQRVASLLYISVNTDILGAVSGVGKVISLSSPWLIVDGGTWIVEMQNTGKAHFRSDYSVKIYDLLNREVAKANSGSSLILPNTIREIIGNVPNINFPGLYKIKYSFGLNNSRAANYEYYILYMPIWLIIIVSFGLICVGYLIIKKVKHRLTMTKV